MPNWLAVGQGEFTTIFPSGASCLIYFSSPIAVEGGLYKRLGVGQYQLINAPVGPHRMSSPVGIPNVWYAEQSGNLYRTADAGLNWETMPNAVGQVVTRMWCKDNEDACYNYVGKVGGGAHVDTGSVWKNGTKIITWPAHEATEQSFSGEGVLSTDRIFLHFGYPNSLLGTPQITWLDGDASPDINQNRDNGGASALPGFNIWPVYGHADVCHIAQVGLQHTGILKLDVGTGNFSTFADLEGIEIGCIRHGWNNHTLIAHGLNGDIYRSTDEGANWTQVHGIDGTLECQGGPSLANDLTDSNNWFAVETGLNSAHVAVSSDDGATWSVESGPNPGGLSDQCQGVMSTG